MLMTIVAIVFFVVLLVSAFITGRWLEKKERNYQYPVERHERLRVSLFLCKKIERAPNPSERTRVMQENNNSK